MYNNILTFLSGSFVALILGCLRLLSLFKWSKKELMLTGSRLILIKLVNINEIVRKFSRVLCWNL